MNLGFSYFIFEVSSMMLETSRESVFGNGKVSLSEILPGSCFALWLSHWAFLFLSFLLDKVPLYLSSPVFPRLADKNFFEMLELYFVTKVPTSNFIKKLFAPNKTRNVNVIS